MIHLYDLRCGTDHDDWELGIRVASALHAENHGGWASRYDMIVLRAYGAARFARMRRTRGTKK